MPRAKAWQANDPCWVFGHMDVDFTRPAKGRVISPDVGGTYSVKVRTQETVTYCRPDQIRFRHEGAKVPTPQVLESFDRYRNAGKIKKVIREPDELPKPAKATERPTESRQEAKQPEDEQKPKPAISEPETALKPANKETGKETKEKKKAKEGKKMSETKKQEAATAKEETVKQTFEDVKTAIGAICEMENRMADDSQDWWMLPVLQLATERAKEKFADGWER